MERLDFCTIRYRAAELEAVSRQREYLRFLMDIAEFLSDQSVKWSRNAPATPAAIQDLVSQCAIDLPAEYLELLRYSNGGEGELGHEPGWFQLWPAEQVIQLNEGYEVTTNVPGIFAFGSSGGGEMLAFDSRGEKPWSVVMIPFILMQFEDAKVITKNLQEFVKSMGREFAA